MKEFVVPIALSLSLSGAAMACPDGADRADDVAALYTLLQGAPSQADADLINVELWKIWTTAPDPDAQTLLDEGMAHRQSYDFNKAEEILTDLTEYCPKFAEGWNQRAFVRFLRQDYGNALDDLDTALTLDPVHTGALSGKALTLYSLGRIDAAQGVLRQAVKLNPWLPERAYLPGDERPRP